MKRLHRSLTDKKIAGVCGGIGETYGLDPTLIRLGMVFLLFTPASPALLITYIVGWIIIPQATNAEEPR